MSSHTQLDKVVQKGGNVLLSTDIFWHNVFILSYYFQFELKYVLQIDKLIPLATDMSRCGHFLSIFDLYFFYFFNVPNATFIMVLYYNIGYVYFLYISNSFSNWSFIGIIFFINMPSLWYLEISFFYYLGCFYLFVCLPISACENLYVFTPNSVNVVYLGMHGFKMWDQLELCEFIKFQMHCFQHAFLLN